MRQAAEGLELIRIGCECFDEVEGLQSALIRARVAVLHAAQHIDASAALVERYNDRLNAQRSEGN